MEKCSSCGAANIAGRSCENIFDEFLFLEFSNPEFGKVHFLTVACYMIQHNRYSDEGLIWMEQKLRDYFEKKLTPEMIRIQTYKELNQKTRSWKILRTEDHPLQFKASWSKTITDVAANYINSESYCELVTQWAMATLLDMQPLIKLTSKHL